MLLAGVQGIRAQTTVGSGSYATAGAFAVPTTQPRATPDFAQPIKSAQGWVTFITKRFSSSHAADLTIGIMGLNAEAARVASYSHGSVTAR